MRQVLRITDDLPRQFMRGQDLFFVMELPQTVPERWYDGWIPTCQLRRLENPDPEGLIADISVAWTDERCIALQFKHDDTADWPLGPAEFDVVFTSPEGVRKRSLPVRIIITYGVTE